VARCGCSGTCACTLRAGTGVTISGQGTAASPWVVTAGCVCALQAGTGVTVTGAGTTASPWVVSAVPASCNTTMDCVGSKIGSGLAFNAGTRVVSAKISGDASNTVAFGTDGGIYVPPASAPGSIAITATDTADIDFTGNGTTGAPLTAVLKPAAHSITTTDSADVDFSGDGSAASPLTAVLLGAKWAKGVTTTTQSMTGTQTKYPLTSVTGTAGTARLVSGSLVIDVAGTYVVTVSANALTNEAQNVAAIAQVVVAGVLFSSRGAAIYGIQVMGTSAPLTVTAGQSFDVFIGGVGMAAGANFTGVTVSFVRIGP
jgi:hypothetical protein